MKDLPAHALYRKLSRMDSTPLRDGTLIIVRQLAHTERPNFRERPERKHRCPKLRFIISPKSESKETYMITHDFVKSEFLWESSSRRSSAIFRDFQSHSGRRNEKSPVLN